MPRHVGLPRAFDLTRWAYFLDFLLGPIAVLALLGFAWSHAAGVGLVAMVSAFALGVLMWSLAEYWIHRSIFHGSTPFEPMHQQHHALPKDMIGAASWVTLSAFSVLWLLADICAGLALGSVATAGVMTGYLFYCTIHIWMHHAGTFGFGRYGQMMRRLHQAHHRGGKGNFGVTSPVWDIVFTTYRKETRPCG